MSPGAELPSQSHRNARYENGTGLKLVYRALRLISDWSLSGFFSEVYVEGAENVKKEGPLILTPCHHNEIIDIATLSATVPHRRIISYWAKESLFKHPVSRFILTSAGALPVARTPRPQVSRDLTNGTEPDADRSATVSSSLNGRGGHQVLFEATYKELAKREGAVLGVFPEGTSYTLPHIVQVKEGAARVALGYIRWCAGDTPNDPQRRSSLITIVPVGIVYTDKSRYRSRLSVSFGTPIDLCPFISRYTTSSSRSNEDDESMLQESVRSLTEEIEKRMLELTVNAPNWSTLYAAQTARALLWPEERRLLLKDFVKVSRTLVAVFEHPSPEIDELKNYLLRYHALLFYTNISHAALIHIPFPPSYHPHQEPHRVATEDLNRTVLSKRSAVKLAAGLPLLVVKPLLSLPTHIAHAPAYALGALVSQIFAGEEEEGRAQYKTIFGGLGRVLGTLATAFALVRWTSARILLRTAADASVAVMKSCSGIVGWTLSHVTPLHDSESMEVLGERCISLVKFIVNFVRSVELGRSGDLFSVLVIAWLLIEWHARVIDSNYLRYKKACATLTILQSVLASRRVGEVGKEELKPYLSTPPPPINPFIAKSLQVFPEDTMAMTRAEKAVDSIEIVLEKRAERVKLPRSTLVKHLLMARADAVESLQWIFRRLEKGNNAHNLVKDLGFLKECGAVF